MASATETASSSGQAQVRLTEQVRSGGCASKLAPGTLSAILSRLPPQHSPNRLVGFETADDAGVYKISEEQALVQTVDFFTPMVDDPFTYGRIAATNALSDVYAMGGRPITALSLVCYPQDGDTDVLEQILRGGLEVMEGADCVVLGGHSVRDAEMKFGYAVTGLINPHRVLTNSGARAGDALVLTKALGTGVITTALKQRRAQSSWVAAATSSMTLLNRRAAEVVAGLGAEVHAMTDVTGFGLIGHARELALGSKVRLSIEISRLGVLPGALEAVELGCIPGGLIANRDFAECVVDTSAARGLDMTLYTLLFDPQTAGGLLISVAPGHADFLVRKLRDSMYPSAAVVGAVEEGQPGIVLR